MATAALVGRPNVGKSTLFNRLTQQRAALVADVPGLTRDRRYGRIDDGRITLIDTGGLHGDDPFAGVLAQQVELALDEADLVLWVVDARDGVLADDEDIAAMLRRRGLPTLLVINKIDGLAEADVIAEFAGLAFAESALVSASQGRGMATFGEQLRDLLAPQLAAEAEARAAEDADADDADDVNAPGERIAVALIGRPNVGKSTLTNRLLGEERQVVFDAPGTTRDAIDIPMTRGAQRYLLIDTAGVRRKGRTEGIVEKFSVVKTLDAIERAQVILLVIDASEGLVEQDLHLLGYALDAGRGIALCVNKWDAVAGDERAAVLREIDRRLGFAGWIPVAPISAQKGTGVGKLWGLVRRIHRGGALQASSRQLTTLLENMVTAHGPPSVRGRPIKLRFAHPSASYPPTITVHGNQTASVPDSYMRFLENGYRNALKIFGNPVRIRFKTGDNPYAGRSNALSDRQKRRRGRMIEHRKKRDKQRRKSRR
ncbi:MAG: ribosome biogenesis GTPase Der [Pseudomonadota bacterium]